MESVSANRVTPLLEPELELPPLTELDWAAIKAAWVENDAAREAAYYREIGADTTEFERELLHFLATVYLDLRITSSLSVLIISEYLGECLDWAVAYRKWRLRVAPAEAAAFMVDLMGDRAPRDDFETWLVRRWLAEIRSVAFRQSAEFEYLRAEWERQL
jgi:hypothetical protein